MTESQQQTPPDQFENKVIGNYEVMKPIGKGKFAVVYRAKRRSDGESVALKRISVDMMDEKAREKCLKEVRLLQSLDHPNIIRYLDSFIVENDLVIVVEWAAAGDLKRQLRKAQERGVGFDERVIWKYFSQMCDAMRHMHERRIMHRDLKPANIFLTLDGTIKVGDLGLSRELSEDTIQAHSKVGTPLYMSPEVLRGDGYDFKSDIWSLGCLLYELAMLKSPFRSEGLNLYSLFQKISQGAYDPLPEIYSKNLRDLATSMISTNPNDRPDLVSVCELAARMRQQTTEQYLKNKKLKEKNKDSQVEKENTATDIRASSTELLPRENDSNTRKQESAKDAKKGEQGEEEDVERRNYNNGDNTFARNQNLKRLEDNTSSVSPKKSPSKKAANSRKYSDENENVNGSPNPTKEQKKASWNRDEGQGQGEGQGEEAKMDYDGRRRKDTSTTGKFSPKKENIDRNGALGGGRPDSQLSLEDQPVVRSKSNKGKTAARPVDSRNSRLGIGEDEDGEEDETFERVVVPASAVPVIRGKDDNVEEKFRGLGNVIYSMEILYGKLQILGYPIYSTEDQNIHRNQKLLPWHFMCELTSIGLSSSERPSANTKKNSKEAFRSGGVLLGMTQFGRFVEVTEWIIQQLEKSQTGNAKYGVTTFSTEEAGPLTLVKQMLVSAEKLGVSSSELAGITPTSLIYGYGENVCAFLNLLADGLLKAREFSWKSLKYEEDDVPAERNDDIQGDEDDGDVEEEAGIGVDTDLNALLDGDLDKQETSDDALLLDSVILPSVPTAEWRIELERITPKLAERQVEINGGNASWSSHLQTISKNAKLIWKIDDTKDVSSRRDLDTEEKTTKKEVSSEELVQGVSMLIKDLNEMKRSISQGENVINNSMKFKELSQEYAASKQVSLELEEKQQTLSKQIEALTNSLAEIDEKFSEVTDLLRSKTDEGGESGSGGSVLKFREAIKNIKGEIQVLTVTVGLLEAQLLKIRVSKSKYRNHKSPKVSRNKYTSQETSRSEVDLWDSL